MTIIVGEGTIDNDMEGLNDGVSETVTTTVISAFEALFVAVETMISVFPGRVVGGIVTVFVVSRLSVIVSTTVVGEASELDAEPPSTFTIDMAARFALSPCRSWSCPFKGNA